MKNKSFNIANMPKYGYINRALGKISKLALVGYEYSAHTVRLKGFFCMRNISMRSHLNGEAGEGHLRMCWLPMSPVCYLLQPRHQLAVNGKASIKYIGAHNHA